MKTATVGIVAAAVAMLFLAASFSGCIFMPYKDKSTPKAQEVKIAPSAGNVLLPQEAYEAVPLFAPLFRNHGVWVALGNAPATRKFVGMEFADISSFSSRLATEYYNASRIDSTWLRGFFVDAVMPVATTDETQGDSDGADGADDYGSFLYSDASLTSEQDETEMRDINPPFAIVVDCYETAIRVSTMATILDAPILFYGETTADALKAVGAASTENVILAGDLPENLYADNTTLCNLTGGTVRMRDSELILDNTLSLAAQAGYNISYITVVNANDGEELGAYYPGNSKSPYTPRLSCFGPMFSAFRGGVTLAVDAVPKEIDWAIQDVADRLKAKGMEPEYLLMLGDSISLPFVYYWIEGYEGENTVSQVPGVGYLWGPIGKVPTDNVYADLENRMPEYNQSNAAQGFPKEALTVELANGRIVARELSDLSDYFYRIVDYGKLLDAKAAPETPLPFVPPAALVGQIGGYEWNNNALSYCATLAEFGAPEQMDGHFAQFFVAGKFNSQELTAYGHTSAAGVGNAGELIAPEFTRSNFIIAGPDHGSPQGNSVSYDQLLRMPPNVNFQVSCLTGMIDNYETTEGFSVTKKDSFAYSMLENGVATFVAAMRPSIMTAPPSIPSAGVHTGNAGELSFFFFEELVKNDCTVGEALQNAKARLEASDIPTDETVAHGNTNRVALTVFEYQLYGDPAFNPYEPCNEGTN
ncbi:MAG: hypothetical protein CVT48_03470 [Thermoplasmata archaeon HGW-Thermoplasmata-1]|nr:MAG: hypothetical protein CVT48_03470 [Thermoplasmata archaeon HGW-Thermoplasmata-1]